MRHKSICTTRIVSLVICAIACALAAAAIACFTQPSSAAAVTAAEKQAEADAVFSQIDSLQTSLNEANAQYEEATAAHEDAVQKRDEAARQIEEETKRIESLQDEMSAFAKGMYKQGGTGSYLDVLMQTTSFEDFLTSWDVLNTVSNKGSELLRQEKQAREQLEQAKADYEAETERAEEQVGIAEERMAQIAQTQAALREEAQKLSSEAAELQQQEELAAEAARQAEEARQAREAAIAAAYEAAESGEPVSAAAGASVLMGGGYFTDPLPGATLSSDFGYRTFDNSFHKGVDLAAPEGTPYYAADGGTVMYATNDGGYNGGAGNWVVIAHGDGIVTKYMHSLTTFVSPGDQVQRGQNIGLVGNTGNSFGAHLHFQVEVDGVAVNPLNYI